MGGVMFLKKLVQCFTVWRVPVSVEKDIAQADVIIAQSFGVRQHNDPGASNEALAHIAAYIHAKYGIPLIAQWEIAHCITNTSDIHVIRNHRTEGKYLDTYEVLAQAQDICLQNGWSKIIILAHPHHYWRCVMTAKKMGCTVVKFDTGIVPYDWFSDQVWTRHKWFFIPREVLVRVHYLCTGKI